MWSESKFQNLKIFFKQVNNNDTYCNFRGVKRNLDFHDFLLTNYNDPDWHIKNSFFRLIVIILYDCT